MGRPPLALGVSGRIRVKELPRDPEKPSPRRWQARVRFRDLDGVTRQASATEASYSKAEAAVKAALLERSGPRGGPMNPDSRYSAVAEIWIAEVKKTLAPTTHDTYRSLLDSVVLPRFGELRLREITTARVAFVLDQLGTRYTPNGVRQIRKVISGPLEKARAWQVIDRNPAQGLGPIRGRAKKSRALTLDERERLLAFIDSDDDRDNKEGRHRDLGDLVRFLLGTGCRIGEALGLRWRDVDLDRSRCHINGSIVRVRGRESLLRTAGKTDAANRHLFLPDFVVLALGMRWDARDMDLDMPVFPTVTGTWRDPNNIQRDFRYVRSSVRDAAGVADLEWLTSHTFRRTAATILDEAGLSPRQIADQLGHSRPSMSQDVYMAREGLGPERAATALGKGLTKDSVQ